MNYNFTAHLQPSAGNIVLSVAPIPPQGGTPSEQRRDLTCEGGFQPQSPAPVRLEIRGVTSHKQVEFWARQTHYRSTVAAKLRSIGQDERANRLDWCHSETLYSTCKGCSKTTTFTNRCDQLFCPSCQPRLANERKKAVEFWTREIKQPKHLVLTLKNTPDLTRQHVQELKRWFSKLRRTKFAANWRGGFYTIEITNEGRGWHLHLHALIDADWIDQIQLSHQWARVTGNFGRIVKVKSVRDKSYLQEVTKYAVKGTQLAAWPPQQILTFIRSLERVRTFGVFGSLYGKRTQWRDWLATLLTKSTTCECGCNEFWIRNSAEWDAAQQRARAHVPTGKPAPPPILQLQFTAL